MRTWSDRGASGKVYAIALTRPGACVAERIAERLPGVRALAPARFAAGAVEGFDEPVSVLLKRLWPEARGFFLVMAAGIAVRSMAPLLTDKAEDPAVVVLDPAGRFAVPLLSGHLGGANDLARELGRVLGATPVITTATDAVGKPAVEVWARKVGLRWEGRQGVVRVNAAWGSGEPVGGYVDPALGSEELLHELEVHLSLLTTSEGEASSFPGVLLAVTHRARPVPAALFLRPPSLFLGVGCRKGADPEAVGAAVLTALERNGLSPLAVANVASVDEKATEPAFLSLAARLGVPFRTYPARELARVPVPTPSARVLEAMGTESVSEAAAILSSGGGPLIVPKIGGKFWTLAVALGNAKGESAKARKEEK